VWTRLGPGASATAHLPAGGGARHRRGRGRGCCPLAAWFRALVGRPAMSRPRGSTRRHCVDSRHPLGQPRSCSPDPVTNESAAIWWLASTQRRARHGRRQDHGFEQGCQARQARSQ
jgi:hypothetical protein